MALARVLAAVSALAAGWTLSFAGLLLLVWPLAEILATSLGAPRPPPADQVFEHIQGIGLFALFAQVALFLALPLPLQLRLVFGRARLLRVRPDHPLSRLAAGLAQRLSLPPPSVYVLAGEAANAFAYAAPFRSAVVVTEGLLHTLTAEELAWVIGHELGHIRYGDTLGGAYWLVAARLLRLAQRLRRLVITAVIRLTAPVPFLNLVGAGAVVAASWVLLVLDLVAAVAGVLFVLCDRGLGRAMEYRADRVATRLLGPAAGARALGKLAGGIEPRFGGLFASHPTTARRIRRVWRQAH